MPAKRPQTLPFGFPPKYPEEIRDAICLCSSKDFPTIDDFYHKDKFSEKRKMFLCGKCEKPNRYDSTIVFECIWCGLWTVQKVYSRKALKRQSCAVCSGDEQSPIAA